MAGNRACSLSYTGGCKTKKSFPVKIENYFILCVRILSFIITLFAHLYARVDIILTCGKYDRVMSPRGQVWVHKTSLTPPHFIELPVPSQESERSCIYVLGLSILPFCDFSIGFWNFSDSVVFLSFDLYVSDTSWQSLVVMYSQHFHT